MLLAQKAENLAPEVLVLLDEQNQTEQQVQDAIFILKNSFICAEFMCYLLIGY